MATDARTTEALLRFRNRDIGPRALEFLRATIATSGWRTRNELSRLVCEAGAWRQRRGGLSEFACRDLWLRLEQWGHLDLGVRRRRGPRGSGRKKSGIPPALIPIAEIPRTDAEANLDARGVRPIEREERLGGRRYMEREHSLGVRPLVGEPLRYAASLDTELVALLGGASAAFRMPVREGYVGGDAPTRQRHLHLGANNVRFLVLPGVRVRHLASNVLAANLRRRAHDGQRVWKHPVSLAETCVARARFRGTCDRAAHWTYLGQRAGRGKRGHPYREHGIPNAVFVYELHRRTRELLCAPEPRCPSPTSRPLRLTSRGAPPPWRCGGRWSRKTPGGAPTTRNATARAPRRGPGNPARPRVRSRPLRSPTRPAAAGGAGPAARRATPGCPAHAPNASTR